MHKDKEKRMDETDKTTHLKEKIDQDIEQYETHKEQFNEKAETVKKQIEEKTIRNVRRNTYSFKRLFHAAFNLSADQAEYDEIDDRIESGVVLRGTNMCILILAIYCICGAEYEFYSSHHRCYAGFAFNGTNYGNWFFYCYL